MTQKFLTIELLTSMPLLFLLSLTLFFTACQASLDRDEPSSEVSDWRPPPRITAPSGELLPFIQETRFEMHDNYTAAVELVRVLRRQEGTEAQEALLDAYITWLIGSLDRLDQLIALAEERSATAEERDEYRAMVKEWREKSNVVFAALQREEQ